MTSMRMRFIFDKLYPWKTRVIIELAAYNCADVVIRRGLRHSDPKQENEAAVMAAAKSFCSINYTKIYSNAALNILFRALEKATGPRQIGCGEGRWFFDEAGPITIQL